ncbi:hypothetical protein QRX50_19730 [Amycolatopsis carbonis]|uniref:Uncharacterized protein n=1 Tax=Amycolatopsis carbonis TaxID=715471 RepID=A0A9Y2IMW2_9PSEU|nr:hypothetical protein [Amycolatopsis sp. 2-15]WIX82844.1 hypothetical protein QRX50_19730 [Amycolatopsis sp. 2-15]
MASRTVGPRTVGQTWKVVPLRVALTVGVVVVLVVCALGVVATGTVA